MTGSPLPFKACAEPVVCPSCDWKGDAASLTVEVCESCNEPVVWTTHDGCDVWDCPTPDCRGAAYRMQCPVCGAGVWWADNAAEYAAGEPEPAASRFVENVELRRSERRD